MDAQLLSGKAGDEEDYHEGHEEHEDWGVMVFPMK